MTINNNNGDTRHLTFSNNSYNKNKLPQVAIKQIINMISVINCKQINHKNSLI